MKKQNYSSMTMNLFSALSENNRLSRIDSVVKTFNRIMSGERGEVVCIITSAKVCNVCVRVCTPAYMCSMVHWTVSCMH